MRRGGRSTRSMTDGRTDGRAKSGTEPRTTDCFAELDPSTMHHIGTATCWGRVLIHGIRRYRYKTTKTIVLVQHDIYNKQRALTCRSTKRDRKLSKTRKAAVAEIPLESMLRVIEYFAKSFKVTQGHSKRPIE